MDKSALILCGGWDGHTPEQISDVFAEELEKKGFKARIEKELDCLTRMRLKQLNLIIPVWTMGQMTGEQSDKLREAVAGGVGLAGVHGGMGDAFRGNISYEWMVGGLFVGHPYIGPYTVKLTDKKSPITKGMKKSFRYESEQYYMMCDPGNTVLATSVYKHEGRKVVMPVIWTKKWKKARVFYSALGHEAEEFRKHPEVLAMTVRGMLWAAK